MVWSCAQSRKQGYTKYLQTISFARKSQGRNHVCVIESRSHVFIAVDGAWSARYPLGRGATHTATELRNLLLLRPIPCPYASIASAPSSSMSVIGSSKHSRRHHRSSSIESTESSAVRKRQSGILNQWAARQAQKMIITMERYSRELEFLSLAGLYSVSTRAVSSLVQIWWQSVMI